MMSTQTQEALKMVIDNLELQYFNTVNATLIAYCKEALATHEESSLVQSTIKESLNVEQPDIKHNALEMAGFELDGVIADLKMGDEFDRVCFDTVVRVRKTIADYVAQPAQDEKFCDANCVWTDHHPDCKFSQLAQEPVAWIYEWEDEKTAKLTFHPDSKAKVIPLYTHPAPSWQGLSVDERYSIIEELSEYDFDADNYDVAVFVEQALKEKNT